MTQGGGRGLKYSEKLTLHFWCQNIVNKFEFIFNRHIGFFNAENVSNRHMNSSLSESTGNRKQDQY